MRVVALCALFFLSLYARVLSQQVQAAHLPESNNYVGNEACTSCHQSIYRSYMQTAMANASGPATQALIPVSFGTPLRA